MLKVLEAIAACPQAAVALSSLPMTTPITLGQPDSPTASQSVWDALHLVTAHAKGQY